MKKFTFTFSHATVLAFIISLCAVGLFHDAVACFFGAAALALLIFRLLKTGHLTLHKNLTFWTVLSIPGFYLLSVLWALDRGMAFVGFLKFLPLLLFLLLAQQDPETKPLLLKTFPPMMAALTLVSCLLSLFPGFGESFLVADRLAGTLQYPNTFALLLLVAQLLLVGQRKWDFTNISILLVLLAGLLYTGSRTVFALAVPANLILALSFGTKKTRWLTLSIITAVTALTLILAAVSGSAVLGRFLRFSFKESTFAGRILYWLDAAPVILKHPFGLGYRGYYYIQQSIQSGVYATMFAHNDLLQLLLDIGWIPAILLLVLIFRTLKSKTVPFLHKLVLCVIFLHSCFDFDLQFISVFFLLFLLTDWDAGKEVTLKSKNALTFAAAALTVLCLYMGAALTLSLTGNTVAARKLYEPNTDNNIRLLLQTEDSQKATALAKEIIDQNEYVTVAYSMVARQAFSQGDFTTMIACKKEIFTRAPFQHDEYIDYCQMLLVGMELYQKAGDTASRDLCLRELLAAKKAVETLDSRLSPLGKAIKDQPDTSFPAELAQAIEGVQR